MTHNSQSDATLTGKVALRSLKSKCKRFVNETARQTVQFNEEVSRSGKIRSDRIGKFSIRLPPVDVCTVEMHELRFRTSFACRFHVSFLSVHCFWSRSSWLLQVFFLSACWPWWPWQRIRL